MQRNRYQSAPLLALIAMIMAEVAPLLGDEAAAKKLSAQVDRLFSKWDRPDSPGIAVAIVREGKLVHSRGYGMANLDHAVPIDSTAIFEIASVTKSFTTACIALLLDDGEVKLDDDIRKYIPELAKVHPPIKVRHLLRCESGFRDYYISLQLAGWNVLDAWTKEDVLQLIAAQKRFDFRPGEQFAYSNSDFFLLALVVERATGKSLAEFAKERLFRPLKMESTFYATDPSSIVQKRATGYERKWRTRKYHAFELRSGTIGPFGLKTTLEDLYRWDQNFYDNKLTAGPHFQEFLATGCMVGNRNCLESSPETSYRGADRNWYTGGMPGFMAQFIRFPKHRFAIILLCNISDPAEWAAMTENAKRIADLYLGDQLEPKLHTAVSPKPPVVNVPVNDLQRLAGSYRRTSGPEEGFVVNIGVDQEQLVFTDHFGRETRLEATSSTHFYPIESELDMKFEFSVNDGEQRSLTNQGGFQLESGLRRNYGRQADAGATHSVCGEFLLRRIAHHLLHHRGE